MKKDLLKGIVIGSVSSLIIASGVGLAQPISKQIEAIYNNIKITVDGTTITPQDSGGNIVDPFISDGTTYLPVRAISNALGCSVDWDGTTNTVNIRNDSKHNIYDAPLAVTVAQNPFDRTDNSSAEMSNPIIYNDKIYISLDEITSALGCRVSYIEDENNVVVSSLLYVSPYMTGSVGDTSKTYTMLTYQPADDINDMTGAKYFIDVDALTDAGLIREILQNNHEFIWSYNINNYNQSWNNDYTNNYEDDKRKEYELELAKINAKYDAMIETLRSSYSNGGNSMSITIMGQQIVQYEQERQNEIDILNAKYGY